VRLVDGEQRDPSPIEKLLGGGHTEPFRCHVQQVELAPDELLPHQPLLVGILGGVQKAGAHAQRAQRVHLVLHQRDQRRDHHASPGPDQCRDLVAQRLAAAGRHQHEGVPARDDVLDDLALPAAEIRIAEHAVEHIDGRGGHRAILEATGRRAGGPVDSVVPGVESPTVQRGEYG
jgi:hypothetical protein